MDVKLKAKINGENVYYLRIGQGDKVIMTDDEKKAKPLSKHMVPNITAKLMGQYENVETISILII